MGDVSSNDVGQRADRELMMARESAPLPRIRRQASKELQR
jgi:hypothetical protein